MIVCNYVNFIGLLCVTFERRPCGRTRRTFLITKISYAAERRTLIKEIFLYLKSVKLEERHAPPWSLSPPRLRSCRRSPLPAAFLRPPARFGVFMRPQASRVRLPFLSSHFFAPALSSFLSQTTGTRPSSHGPSSWCETPPCPSFSNARLCHGFIACLLNVSALVKISIPSHFCRVLCLTGLTRVLTLYFVCAPKIF